MGQISVRHTDNIEHLTLDLQGGLNVVDSKHRILELQATGLKEVGKIKEKNIIAGSSCPLLIDGKTLNELNGGVLKKLYAFDKIIIDAQYVDKYVAVVFADELIFRSHDTTFNCSLNVGTSNAFYDIRKVRDKFYYLDSLGMRELCNESGIEFIMTKPGITPVCSVNKNSEELFIGTSDKGLWTFKNDTYKQFYIPGIVFPKYIQTLKMSDDNLWILSGAGALFKLNLNSQIYKKVANNVDHFIFDYWNTLFMSSGKELIKSTAFINKRGPQLNAIFVNGQKVTQGQKVELDKDSSLEVDIETKYSPGGDLSLEYQLDDNPNWVKADDPHTFEIQSLTPGNHKLTLRLGVDGQHYSWLPTIEIYKKGPIVGSFWIYLFGGLLLLLLLAFFSQRKISKENAKLKSDKEKLKMQVEVLKTKQKMGQLQLNPHFLFNTLNSINGLIALGKNKEARQSLNSFSQMMRSVLENSKEDVISIEDEIHFLEKYLSLEKLIRNNMFDFEIISEKMDAKILPMIIQPFVENAVIHGLKHKKEKGQLTISLKAEGTYVNVVVEDNGIGRVAAKQYRSEGHKSSAIQISEDRLKSADKWQRKKHISYQDLENPTGTIVILNIPKQ